MLTRNRTNLLLTATLALSMLAGIASANFHPPSQEPQERLVEDSIPKQVPIRVNLNVEKEAKFKDLNNSDWIGDFELEVTNKSDKPIYFLELWLLLPDTKSENNNPIAFSLRYGRVDFIHFNTRPIATDVPIQPGETHTFTIPVGKQQGWREFKRRRKVPDPRGVKIELVHLSFGDGSGFDGGGESYPYRRGPATGESEAHNFTAALRRLLCARACPSQPRPRAPRFGLT